MKNFNTEESSFLIKHKRRDDHNYKQVFEYLENFIEEEKTPLFNQIEIETINKCNETCSFCPVNKNHDSRELKIMSKDLFNNIISQLKNLNYIGRVSLYSNNEPFLDKRILNFIKIAKDQLPSAYHTLFTNGTLLNVDKFITAADNLDLLFIDNYNDHPEMIESVKKIYNYCIKHPEYQKKVIIALRERNEVLSSRGGYSPNRNKIANMKSSCPFPFSQIVIRPDGKVSQCCNDALGVVTMGDLNKNTLVDIWNGDKYIKLREKLARRKNPRKNLPLCSECDEIFQHIEILNIGEKINAKNYWDKNHEKFWEIY